MVANSDSRVEILPAQDRTALIASLNDALRCEQQGGTLAVTRGVLALPAPAVLQLLVLVQTFDAFTLDNDPYGERDFGVVDWVGTRIFWKIDCFDRALQYASPDPADPDVTTRVLTIMLAEEW